MRTTGSVVERGCMRRLHGRPGSVTAAGGRPGCCTPVLHAGDLDAQASKYVQTGAEVVGGEPCDLHAQCPMIVVGPRLERSWPRSLILVEFQGGQGVAVNPLGPPSMEHAYESEQGAVDQAEGAQGSHVGVLAGYEQSYAHGGEYGGRGQVDPSQYRGHAENLELSVEHLGRKIACGGCQHWISHAAAFKHRRADPVPFQWRQAVLFQQPFCDPGGPRAKRGYRGWRPEASQAPCPDWHADREDDDQAQRQGHRGTLPPLRRMPASIQC